MTPSSAQKTSAQQTSEQQFWIEQVFSYNGYKDILTAEEKAAARQMQEEVYNLTLAGDIDRVDDEAERFAETWERTPEMLNILANTLDGLDALAELAFK